ncbi:protein kinase (plasmid) [Gemmatirosa kalamazoonensis]|uniref:non-specific serine/threonine protein kinase n=1 Tax=Gemmatirosa kalamazoonensis TaxID=861299 RepID=W0RMN7_9BACT|nr:serine/threonine-protein kinase [Gemmatirosa kalamazoonensis]AHG92309.1 protein kinase [Gemmatirosa kalamazoonensis]
MVDISRVTEFQPGLALGGRYTIDRELGRGGMARVYLAADGKHDRQVAIKVLLPELTATIGAERFAREIRMIARLQHPHILPLYDSGETNGLLYFVMPFVEGESLRARLDRSGALAFDEATRVVRQVADALDYAHARGVVHRDVKPENILLTGAQALLADFGIARTATESNETLTSVGVTLGTPAYMSPEQAAAEPRVDRRSDIYSLACVAYELLAGAPPFRGGAAAVMAQHVISPPPPLVGAQGPLPPAAGDAVTRALAKEPDERFDTAGDFAATLERALVDARAPSPADLRIRAVERQHAARQRILVLEFANIAAAADADWLSTGIAETLGADLNKIAGLKVVAQDAGTRRRIETVRQGRPVDTEHAISLARSEGARWVVWGAFQKLGTRIRVTTHLAGTEEGVALWEAKLDGVMDDIFALQDRIVTGLAAALDVELTSGELARIRQPQTTRLTAYEHYVRGFRARIQFGQQSTRVAEEHLRAAIALDPGYALAYAELGALRVPMYVASGRREVLDEATELLTRALALDATLGGSWAWLSYMRTRRHEFDDAEIAARRAIDLDPGGFDGWYMLGVARVARALEGHDLAALPGAVSALLRTVHLRPEHFSGYTVLSSLYLVRGAYGHAVGPLDTAVSHERAVAGVRFVGALIQRAALHLGQDELDDAARLLDQAVARYTGADHAWADQMTTYAHWARGCLAERRDASERAREEFARAAEVAEARPHRINIGAHWAKARFGLTRALQRLGRHADAERVFVETDGLLGERGRFVWNWFVGGSDAEVLYERAAALAVMGRSADAVDGLRRAADAGWADVAWLRHDPAFAVLRDDAAVQLVCIDSASRVILPPPVGSGGLA